jgi:hypothetical protein
VVGDGLFLLRGQSRDGLGEVAVEARTVRVRRCRVVRGLGDGYGPASRRPGDVDGLAVGDRDQPRLDVRSFQQVRVGLHRGQERLRPRVLGVRQAEYGAADPQHGCPMLYDDRLKRLLSCHAL